MPGLTTTSVACMRRTVLSHDGDVGARDAHVVLRAQVARGMLQPIRAELMAFLEHLVAVLADLLDAM